MSALRWLLLERVVLQFRLIDRFGDNGVIAVIIGHVVDDGKCIIDDWLMSCRVLGRQVEAAMLNVLCSVAKEIGATQLNGVYRPTAKNGIVADLLARLGFATEEPSNGVVKGALDLKSFEERPDHNSDRGRTTVTDSTKIYDVLRDIFAEVFMRDDILTFCFTQRPRTWLVGILSSRWRSSWRRSSASECDLRRSEVDNFRNVGDLVATVMRRVG